jgi:hypothetical protein
MNTPDKIKKIIRIALHIISFLAVLVGASTEEGSALIQSVINP